MMETFESILATPDTVIYLKKEWYVHRVVMEAPLDVLLADGEEPPLRQILKALVKRELTIPKRLINSILFSEARRYVVYNKETYTYNLRRTKVEEGDNSVNVIEMHNLPQRTQQIEGEVKARYIGRNDEY